MIPLLLALQLTSPPEWRQMARDIYKQLIEINTTKETTQAANAMWKRLLDAGIPEADMHVAGPVAHKGNLVARLRGKNPNLKPILLLAHIDVVEAKREDWPADPFVLREQDGFFYGRGTTDDKAMAAIFVSNLIRMKKEGILPSRDIVLALTADEEGGDYNGVDWLLRTHRDWVEAEFGINEGGGGAREGDKRLLNEVQASEKVYLSFRLSVTNPGGHSSVPVKDNAIYHLADGLARLEKYDFPASLNEVTRMYFQRMAKLQRGQLANDMTTLSTAAITRLSKHRYYNALLRTTCIPTLLSGGHAENALPQLATATVNCRILPGKDPNEVELTLKSVLADSMIKVTRIADAKPSAPSPLSSDIMGPIEAVTQEMWPGVPVVPVMGTGATDGLFFRNSGIPIYGVSGLFEDINDSRAHGRDERLGVQAFYEGQEFLWRLVAKLTS